MTVPDYIDSIYQKTPEWHERRKKVIGGSDANIIMSGDEAAIYRLWQEKRGEAQPEDLSSKLPVLIGTITEKLNVALFQRSTGLVVTGQGTFLTDNAFMGVTLDGMVQSETAVLECKHVGGYEPFEDVVAKYMPQCQHAMILTGYDKCYLSVLIGNHTHRIEKIEADIFYQEQLMDAERQFWDAVQSGVPPVPAPPAEVAPGDAYKIVDMAGNNRWKVASEDYKDFKTAAESFETAKDILKSLVESNVKCCYSNGVIIKRDKRGALRITEGEYEQPVGTGKRNRKGDG